MSVPGFRFDFNKASDDWWIKSITNGSTTYYVSIQYLGKKEKLMTYFK